MQGAGDDPPLGFQLQAASSQPVQPGVLEDSPGEAVRGNAKTARWFPDHSVFFFFFPFFSKLPLPPPPNLDQLWSTACPRLAGVRGWEALILLPVQGGGVS